MSWRQRAARRASVTILAPPVEVRSVQAWHVLSDGVRERLAQWQPGVERWISPYGENWTAEALAEQGWRYVGMLNQSPMP